MADNFKEFVKEFLPDIAKIARGVHAKFRSTVPMDDLTQMGLIGAYNASTSFDSERGASIRTWVRSMAKWEMIKGVREEAQQTRRHMHLADSPVLRITAIEEPIDTKDAEPLGDMLFSAAVSRYALVEAERVQDECHEEAEGALHTKRRKAAMREALNTLPTAQRLAMEGHLEGLTLKEIGVRCGRAESSVCESLAHAEKNLTKILAESGL